MHGFVDLGVAPHSGEIRWKTSTPDWDRLYREGKKEQQLYYNDLPFEVPPEQLEAVDDFDIHIIVRSIDRTDNGWMPCVRVVILKILAKQ